MKYLYWLLVFIPVTLVARFGLHINDGIVFWLSCLGIVPLAAVLGDATEQISMYTGPKVGGFLNATMGNVPELLISGFAVKAGLFSLVLASLAGSILGNLLLVMGMSILVGGLKFKFLPFNNNITHNNLTLLGFAVFGIIVPFFFKLASGQKDGSESMAKFSLALAIIMVVLYSLGLIFSLFTHRDIFLDKADDDEEEEEAKWSLKKGVFVLAAAAALVAVMSEILVSTVEGAAEQYGLGEAFIGIILIPILGNVAEHAAAVIMAYKGKINISIEVAIGSSMQIALFVTPLMIIWSAVIGTTMEYVYTPMELMGIIISAALVTTVFMDHKLNWLEGAELIAAYIVLGGAFLMFGI
jgi:Ca2+:H+ antiporter